MFVLSSSEGTMKVELAPNADVESNKVHNSNNTGWVQNRTIVFTNKGTTKDCVPVHYLSTKGNQIARHQKPDTLKNEN